MKNPNKRWMITRGSPMTKRKSPQNPRHGDGFTTEVCQLEPQVSQKLGSEVEEWALFGGWSSILMAGSSRIYPGNMLQHLFREPYVGFFDI